MIGSVNVPGASGLDLRQVVVTLAHTKSGKTHTFSTLGGRTGLVPVQFKSTARYEEGDTALIDGKIYTFTLTGADEPETDMFVTGKSILAEIDTEAKTINFRSGGGLTKGKLALANATEDTVFNGKTFYAGADKIMRTGRALAEATDVAPENLFNGKKAYDNAGNLVTGTALAEAATATAATIFNGYTAYDEQGNKMAGTGLSQATTAGANDIMSGKTAYNNLGQLITGSMTRRVQAGTVSAVETKTYTINYDNSLGAPKLIIAWFSLDSINSFSPYLFAGAATGAHAGTSIAGRSGNFRNQNQSMADSTYYIGTSYFSFTVDKYDYLSGGSYECSYIFVW